LCYVTYFLENAVGHVSLKVDENSFFNNTCTCPLLNLIKVIKKLKHFGSAYALCMCQETCNNDVVAKTETADSSSSVEHEPSERAPAVKSLPSVGQIYGIHRDGQLDVLWADGSRSLTYLHQLYIIADEVLQPKPSSACELLRLEK